MTDRRISDLFSSTTYPLLSFEFFPPKDEAGMENLKHAAEQLLSTRPDFATCTYGAGGSTRQKTMQVCHLLREAGYRPVMPHLTCVGSSRADLEAMADEMHEGGFRNIMTLRGDPPRGNTTFAPPPDGLGHASDLVRLLKRRHTDFCCGVAAYPEVHPEATDHAADLAYLKLKLDQGGDFATTQLFFNNQLYFDFVARCRGAGISKPILPGLLPAISLKQLERMCAMCKAELPPALRASMEEAGGEGPAAEEAGLQWAIQQMEELFARGVPGVHLYVLNRSKAATSKAFIDALRKHRP